VCWGKPEKRTRMVAIGYGMRTNSIQLPTVAHFEELTLGCVSFICIAQ
jgi:hypothetical protein